MFSMRLHHAGPGLHSRAMDQEAGVDLSQSEAQNPGDGTSSHQGREGRRDRAARLAAKRHSGRPDAADPHFSQPVRQIVLMLIVLVLVGMGTWFAYRQILPIFAANPALNGAILLVFVLGVLTCFWQVGQLVHSVSWIERFAAGKFGYGPLDQTAPERPPRLLAPLAALLGARGPMGGAISTESARSIQDSVATRIDEARDITRYLANLLIFLGLLGTFYGLATTVPAIVETIRTLAPGQGESGIEVFDKLMHGLETQLGGMATAFSSSLLGLAGSLIVGLLELFASHGQNRFYRELEEWLSGFTRIGMSGEGGEHVALAEFLQGVSGQIAGLQDFYAARDVLRDEEAADADSRSMALAAGVQQLTQLVGSDRDALAGQVALERQVASDAQSRLAQMVERLADGQDRLLVAVQAGQGGDSRLEDLTSGLEQAFTSLIERQDRLIALAAQPTAMPPEMAQALERITESQQRLALAAPQPAASGDGAAARALARLADGQARLVELAEARPGAAQDDPEARMRLRSIDVQLGRLVEEAASGRDGLIAELREDMAALTRAIRALEARDGA